KRVAWAVNLLLVVLYLGVIALYLARYQEVREHWFNWFSVCVSTGLLGLLLLGRSEFRAKGDSSNPWLALSVLVGGGALGAAVGTALVPATDRNGASLPDAFECALLRIYTLAPDDRLVNAPAWVDVSLNVLGVLVFLLVLYALFRAPRGKEYLGAADEARLRALLDRHGEQDSLGYFALRRDKSVLFSPSGKAAIAYRVVGGVCLASG